MSVRQPIVLRPFAPADLEAAHRLSQAVAWPHRAEDWRMMAGLGQGFAAVDATGALHGVALWWCHGADFATLGLVIVSPSLQKAGIGRQLMAAIVEAAGGRRIQLNATAEGLRLYGSYGFEEVGGIRQHQGTPSPGVAPVLSGFAVRDLTEADRSALHALDRRASGVDRSATLDTLLPLSQGHAVDGADGLAGFLLVRDFGRGKLLGPLVAEDEPMALALLSSAAMSGSFLRADIPETATMLRQWLDSAGLPCVGQVRTMLRGAKAEPSSGPRIFALASQALG